MPFHLCFSMSCLHIWFSKLKWSMDTLLRFYERHAYVCALHKETKLLFDELIFCLQRLYSVPIRIDLPFANPDFTLEDLPTPMRQRRFEDDLVMKNSCPTCHTSCSKCSSASGAGTPAVDTSGVVGIRKTSLTRSRIPRPISLPKRLEGRLEAKMSNNTSATSCGSTGSGSGIHKQATTRGRPVEKASPSAAAAAKPPISGASSRKSRVRDTIRLFDSKSNRSVRRGTSSNGSSSSGIGAVGGGGGNPAAHKCQSSSSSSPKTGGGEGITTPDPGDYSASCEDRNSRF